MLRAPSLSSFPRESSAPEGVFNPFYSRDHIPGISVFNFTFAQNHTPAPLPLQAQIAMASSGWHRGSIWAFR